MQINLKQNEIELALKNYIAQQGISLYGKEIGITFTAGRKESGISAELTIEEIEIPFESEPDESAYKAKSVLGLVPAQLSLNDSAIQVTPQVSVVQEEEATVEVVTEEVKTNSLFS